MDERVVDVSANAQDAPALDDLQYVLEPSWLWDAGRARVVWANPPGLDFFNSETLFDLIDRRFSRTEAGVARIMELAEKLDPGTSLQDYLAFPSAGPNAALSCTCYQRQLPDGRPGVLVVGTAQPIVTELDRPAELILDALPLAILTFRPDGQVLSANPAAEDLFEIGETGTLGELVKDPDLARRVVQGTLTTGTFSKLEHVECRYGHRDLRLYGQVIGEGTERHIFLMLDDVTDRRTLERHLNQRAESLSDFVASAADFTWELDANYVFVELSDGFTETTGIDTGDILNELWGDVSDRYFVGPDPLIGYYLDQKRAWKAQILWQNGRSDDTVQRLTISGMPLFAPDGSFTGYRGIGARIASAAEPAQGVRAAEPQKVDLGEEPVAPEGPQEDPHEPVVILRQSEVKAPDAPEPEPDTPETEEPDPALAQDDPTDAAALLSEEERQAFTELGEKLTRQADDRTGMPDITLNFPSATGAEATGDEDDDEDAAHASVLEVAVEAVESVIDGLPDAIVVHRDGQLLYLNPYAATLLGYEQPQDALAAHTIEVLFGAYSDDLLLPDGESVTFTSAPYQSGAVKITARAKIIQWPDGPAVQVTLKPAGAQPDEASNGNELGLPENVVRLVRDEIADGQVSPGGPTNADLLAMLNTATDGILTLDEEGNVLSLNSSAEAMFGMESNEVTGRPLAEFLTRDSRDTLERYMAAVSDSGIASVLNDGREVTGIEKNGGQIPLFLTLGRLGLGKDEADQVSRYCAVLRDMTSWKKTETELVQAREAAERASAQKSEFLANISHEIRTPLNAILGFSEVMKARRFGAIENDKYSGYVNDIHSSGEHLLSLINDLLDLSKVEAGKLELNFASVDLGDVVTQCVKLLSDSAREARVIVRTSIQEGLPNVVADQRSMRQIVLNLLSNAIKFTDGGGQVIVSARLEKSGNISLKVKDTGRGMSEPEVERAMEPFRQVEPVSGDG
ncbi:MAG: PAS domain S-box protein, partial [Rhizobiales bacterium]|nr:PAS domain S-box protein [Hyphomicrobiales bacterium]